MIQEDKLNPNAIAQFLGKEPASFTMNDLIRFIEEKGVRMVNFRYPAEDGKLKTLNFIIQSRKHLVTILSGGERVDGSSLFSFISAGSSDLYIMPRYRTAFLNPFSEIPALDLLCEFYTSEGKPLENSPGYILKKAYALFREKTGYNFKAMGELEYYVNSQDDEIFSMEFQKGYHSSEPFARWEKLRIEAMQLIAATGASVKYGHAEVGSFTRDGQLFEQHEIEFLPVDVHLAAEQLIIAKWIVRMVAARYGVEVSFAPKITVGMAGSGLHIHMLLEKDGKNAMVKDGNLSDAALKMIAGILDVSEALTAFGNTIPTSYLRLVPGQEAPTRICWGDRNRSVLVRVPLGWSKPSSMINHANSQDSEVTQPAEVKQTVEFRAPDGSAEIYSLLAGLVMAALHGFNMPDALKYAEKLYVDGDIFSSEKRKEFEQLQHLPVSCFESADKLLNKRKVFENENVFPPKMIDALTAKLQSYNDKDLSERLQGKTEEIRKLVIRYIHCM